MNTSNTKRKEIITLAKEIPTLWSRTTNVKDKKRIVRLLISDITITKDRQTKTLFLHVRWQAGPLQQIQVNLPPNAADKTRYPQAIVEKVRELTLQYGDDRKTAAVMNKQGLIGATGKPFSLKMITWIRHKHKIERPQLKFANEYTVDQVEKLFNVSRHMVYYWIKNKQVSARKKTDNTFLVKITPATEKSLREKIQTSYKAGSMLHRRPASA